MHVECGSDIRLKSFLKYYSLRQRFGQVQILNLKGHNELKKKYRLLYVMFGEHIVRESLNFPL